MGRDSLWVEGKGVFPVARVARGGPFQRDRSRGLQLRFSALQSLPRRGRVLPSFFLLPTSVRFFSHSKIFIPAGERPGRLLYSNDVWPVWLAVCMRAWHMHLLRFHNCPSEAESFMPVGPSNCFWPILSLPGSVLVLCQVTTLAAKGFSGGPAPAGSRLPPRFQRPCLLVCSFAQTDH